MADQSPHADQLVTGREFGLAVCAHLNLPADRTCEVQLESAHDQVLGVRVLITVSPADMVAIAARMAQE